MPGWVVITFTLCYKVMFVLIVRPGYIVSYFFFHCDNVMLFNKDMLLFMIVT